MIRTTLILSIIFLLPLAILGQEKEKSFSLKEAQQFAIENNLSKKNAEIDVKIADRKIWETTALGLPQVSAGVDFQAILNELPKLTFPGPPGPDGVPTQTEIEVGERVNATFSITASQLVFSGPYIVGLQASKAFRGLSENALTKSERDLKANVASVYYTVLLLEETTSVLDSSVSNLRRTLEETKALQKAGFVEEVVADQVSVTLSMVENSAKETNRQVESAKNLLKFQLGVDINTNIELSENLEILLNEFAPSPIEKAILDPNQNADLKIMASQMELTALQLKREKYEFLPSVSAFIMYQKLAKEPEINFTPEAVAGARISMPIFSSGMRRSKVQQAQLELEKSKNSYEFLKQSLDLELADAMSQLNTAWEKFQSEKQNKALALKVYQNFRLKYSKGMASQQDIIQANDKHLQAVGNYMGSVVELFNARLRLDKILGNI
jgi:outer membrane protein